MKKENQVLLVIFLLIFMIISNTSLIFGDTSSPELNFNGEWYSKGFTSASSWKSFVGTFTSTLFKFEVAQKNETLQFGITDSNGDTHFFDTPVTYNSQTGELYCLYQVTLPNGEVKYIDYKATLNGESDLRKVVNPSVYFGKTIGEIVSDMLSKNIKIGLIGNRSNITLTAGKNFTKNNPVIDIEYEKNIEEGFTSPLIEATSLVNTSTQNNTGDINSNPADLGINSPNKSFEEPELNNSLKEIEFKIINPKPSFQNISILVNQTQEFSVENEEFDTITWYLNGKLVKKKVKSYDFKSSKKGVYNLSVEIQMGSEIDKNLWKVEVKPIETPKEKKGLLIWIIPGIFFVIFWAGIIYYLKNQGKTKNSQPTPQFQKN